MPVVLISAAEHPELDGLARAVADAVAEALTLAPGDVVTAVTPTGRWVASGGGATSDWIVCHLHGSDRGPDARDDAQRAAQAAARDWAAAHGVAVGGMWTSWLLSTP